MTEARRYPSRPFVGVGVVVWRGAEVLLVRRSHAPRAGQWSLPGGLQELGETVFETARREVREETGLTVSISGLIDVIDSVHRDDDGRIEYHYTLVDVAAEWVAGTARARDDAAELTWADPDDLARFDLWDETVRVIGLSARAR